MKVLCITGSNEKVLNAIASPFYNTGMKRPLSLQRSSEIDFSIWHKKTVDSFKGNSILGRVWIDLATDLLLSNLDDEYWGWAESRSVYSLDFWADQDPNIIFIFACTDLVEEVHQKISEMNSDESVDLEVLLNDWYERHSIMLDFYLRFPNRCILIDVAEALSNPYKHVSFISDKWSLPVTAVPEDAKEIKKNDDRCLKSIGDFLISQFIKYSSLDIRKLHIEIKSAQNFIVDNAINKEDLPLEYSSDESHEIKKEISDALNYLIKIKNNESQYFNEIQYKKVEISNLESKLLESYESNSAQERKILFCEEIKQKASSELKLALNSYNESQEEIKKKALENELLISQLQELQEGFSNLSEKNRNYEKQVQKSLAESLKLEKEKEKVIKKNVDMEKEREGILNELEELKKAFSMKSDDFKKEKNLIGNENKLLAAQLEQVEAELKRYFLENQKVNAQSSLIVQRTEELNFENSLLSSKCDFLLEKINSLGNVVNDRLSFFNYSEIKLINEQVNPDYEHLHLEVSGVSFEDHFADRWSFRISSAMSSGAKFGDFPKIEFPIQDKQLLNQWFSESVDERGKKLELRFALPCSMDKNVWQKIDSQDKFLISSLIEQLPMLLKELEIKGVIITREWSEWLTLTKNMNHIINELS